MDPRRRRILFIVLSMLVLCFIFNNSMQSRAESSTRSSGIAVMAGLVWAMHRWCNE